MFWKSWVSSAMCTVSCSELNSVSAVDGNQETWIPAKDATQLHGARAQFAEHLHSD